MSQFSKTHKKVKPNFIVVVFSLVILVSCSPQRRLARLLEKYPLPTETEIEYRDTIIYRDTVIYIHLPGDTIVDSILIPVEIDMPYMELKRASTYAEATAWIGDNQLGLELIQYDTLFQFMLDSAIRENVDTISIIHNIPYPVIEKPKPFWRIGFLVLAGLILVVLLLFFIFK